ncbi:hypothetical protein KEM55_007012, partial [Ascosphaera atra]
TTSRPLHAAISDDASILVLAPYQDTLHIYDLRDDEISLFQKLDLNDPPRALALCPDGTVLAIAYDESIEICAVGEDATVSDRRTIRCTGIQSLSFSNDGLTLLCSSLSFTNPKIVVIEPTAGFDVLDDVSEPQMCAYMWTSQVLYPITIDGFSHANFLPDGSAPDINHYFAAYDTRVKAYRLLQLERPSDGIIYFVGPGIDGIWDEPEPSTVPTANGNGEALATAFSGSGIWIFGTPTAFKDSVLSNRRNEDHRWSTYLARQRKATGRRTNSQRLKKVLRRSKYLIYGHQLSLGDYDAASVHWVKNASGSGSSFSHRLVVVATPSPNESAALGSTLKFITFDFVRSPENGTKEEVTLQTDGVELQELPDKLDAETGNTIPARSPSQVVNRPLITERQSSRAFRAPAVNAATTRTEQRGVSVDSGGSDPLSVASEVSPEDWAPPPPPYTPQPAEASVAQGTEEEHSRQAIPERSRTPNTITRSGSPASVENTIQTTAAGTDRDETGSIQSTASMLRDDAADEPPRPSADI